ncbi:MAG: hypothetical protein GXP55_02175 [Deltaproteobacteria bacterium]|nr:hypothetical protein [Deltaproteobacteria bacterium]
MRSARLILTWAAASSALACGGGAPPVIPDAPSILTLASADPLLEGSELWLTLSDAERLGDAPTLHIAGDAGEVTLANTGVDGAQRAFRVDAETLATFGTTTADLQLAVSGAGLTTPEYAASLRFASQVPLSLSGPPEGDVHYEDAILLSGDGFLAPTEGDVVARLVGRYSPDSGPAFDVDVSLPVLPAERFARDRGLLRLTTDLGAGASGSFSGNLELSSTDAAGRVQNPGPVPTSFRIVPAELFSLSATTASIEQLVSIRGGGFLGAADRRGETTLLRIEGSFAAEGGPAMPYGPVEIVPRFVSGSEVVWTLDAVEVDGELLSRAFGARWGRLEGLATPITIVGTTEYAGTPTPFAFEQAPTKQVVYMRFLPSFYASLPRFGLGASAGRVEELVAERVGGIYADYNVDVRLEEPTDFSPNGYARVDIGGPDPNGIGLFGYDNTPGKDVGNLRLFDGVGGTNAETQADGYPGYGGVFVESYLYWSSHPELPGSGPAGAPAADPLFDQIFDPVRSEPATLEQVRGEGEAGRVAEVKRALEAFASLVGETVAHELGHSLGLADPYGGASSFHNRLDGEGCLMDSGSARPLRERVQQPGTTPTHFCADAPDYLTQILSR